MQEAKDRQPHRQTKSTYRLLRSTFVWILICLVSFDCFLIGVRPLQYIQIRGLITADQEPLNDKLEYLYSSIVKPDFLLLGSSLPMHACFGADWATKGKPLWPENYILRYTGSSYLNQALSETFHTPLTGYDLGMPACMISDNYYILKDVLEKGIRPKAIIFAIAPRDFIDNMAQPVKGSRYFKYFAERKDGIQVSISKTAEENTENILRHFWRFFKVRADYNRTIEFLVCCAFGRAATIYNAVNGKGYKQDMLKNVSTGLSVLPYKDPKPIGEAVYGDLDVYKRRYLPFNDKRLALEIGYLNSILACCKNQGIEVIVVNMPVHPKNIGLLSATEKEKIFSGITKTCISNGAKFINIANSETYLADDFFDSVHMRSAASLKFFDQLTTELEKEPALAAKLIRNRSLAGRKTAPGL